jgi:DnaK suppressor protein
MTTKKAVAPAAKAGAQPKKSAEPAATPSVSKKAASSAGADGTGKKAGAGPGRAAPAPASKKAASPGPYAEEPKFLEDQRALLITERDVYAGQAVDLRAEADSLALEREPGDVQFDEESGEGGTVAVDRERDLALSAQAAAAVEEIDEALVRIDRKTYGACERCHAPIPKARLRALPYARLCVECKSGGLTRR